MHHIGKTLCMQIVAINIKLMHTLPIKFNLPIIDKLMHTLPANFDLPIIDNLRLSAVLVVCTESQMVKLLSPKGRGTHKSISVHVHS